jgi:hypothetical protein
MKKGLMFSHKILSPTLTDVGDYDQKSADVGDDDRLLTNVGDETKVYEPRHPRRAFSQPYLGQKMVLQSHRRHDKHTKSRKSADTQKA